MNCNPTQVISNSNFKTLRIKIPNSELLTTQPKILIAAPGECKLIAVESIVLKLIYAFPKFNYDANNPLLFAIQGDGLSSPIFKADADDLNIDTTRFYRLEKEVNEAFPALLAENEALQMKANIAPTVGGGSIDIYITYQIIDL